MLPALATAACIAVLDAYGSDTADALPCTAGFDWSKPELGQGEQPLLLLVPLIVAPHGMDRVGSLAAPIVPTA